MLGGVQPAGSLFRRYRAVGSSVAAHMAILAAIVFHHPKPIDITPTWLAWGDSQHSYKITYLPNGNNPAEQARLSLPLCFQAAKPKTRTVEKAESRACAS